MLEDRYKVLGLTPDASDDDIENAYYKIKAQLEEERFLDGEAGNIAAWSVEDAVLVNLAANAVPSISPSTSVNGRSWDSK